MPSSGQRPLPKNQQGVHFADISKAIDLLGPPPGWMLYWGNIIVVCLLGLLLALAGWVSYPDEMEVDIQLTTLTPPIVAAPSTNAYVAAVLAEEGELIQVGQPLLLLDNDANWQAVLHLDTLVQTIQLTRNPIELQSIQWQEVLDVGILRKDYAALLNHLQELQFWLGRDQQGLRAQRIEEQLRQSQQVYEQLDLQLTTAQREQQLAQNDYNRFKALFDEREAASLAELNQAETRMLQSQRQLDLQQQLLYQQEQNRSQLEQEKLRLAESYSEEINVAWLAVQQQARSLRQSIEHWNTTYLLEAKADGILTFLQTINAGQLVIANEPLWSIIPASIAAADFQAIGFLAADNMGRIAIGDQALIRLPSYPYREYGQLEATLSELSLAPLSQAGHLQYRVKLKLPNGLITTYERDDIDFWQQLPGTALITTEKRSLLTRILDRFKHLRSKLE